jgi:hypothetical protein
LSLLTPEYQTRMVQDLYHQGVTNAPQWPSTYCWPEGFIRRRYFAAVNPVINPHQVLVTPELVQILTGVARNFITHSCRPHFQHGGRCSAPRRRRAALVWRDIGFWDGDASITWTSNIQPWTAHGAFEFSNKMQTIEIYTPRRDAQRKVVGFNHEAVFYDPEALVEPIRVVRNFDKTSERRRRHFVRFRRMRSDDLLDQWNIHAGRAGHGHRVPGTRQFRPPMGADVAAVPRAGDDAARERRELVRLRAAGAAVAAASHRLRHLCDPASR